MTITFFIFYFLFLVKFIFREPIFCDAIIWAEQYNTELQSPFSIGVHNLGSVVDLLRVRDARHCFISDRQEFETILSLDASDQACKLQLLVNVLDDCLRSVAVVQEMM